MLKGFFFGDYRRIRLRSYRPRWSVSSLTAIINRKVIPVSIFVFQRMKNNINAGRTSSGKFFTVSFRWVCFTWQGLRLWSQPIYNYRTCLSGGEIVCFFLSWASTLLGFLFHYPCWCFYLTLCQRSVRTASPLPTTTRRTRCFQVGDYAKISVSTTKRRCRPG